MKIFAKNKRALFDYEILEVLEAGLELFGFEVKAIKTGKTSLKGAFALLRQGEVRLLNATVSPYQPKNTPKSYDPIRPRRLLLKKSEIEYLAGKISGQGLTLIPIKLYNKRGRIKLEIALAKSKKKFDKREAIKKKETKREIERALRVKE